LKREKEASEMSNNLTKLQHKDGYVDCNTTITGSHGISKRIEATSLAILCWLNDYSTYAKHVETALRWLYASSKRGMFGSTQGTILALKAIVSYEKLNKRESRSGIATVTIDSKHEIKVNLIPNKNEPTETPDLSEYLTIGDHTISISMSDGCSYPYSLNIDYYSTIPDSSNECSVDLETKLSSDKFKEGDGAEIRVELSNKTDQKKGMTTAIIGLPGGLEPRHEQLKELVKSETIDFYEIKGREVIIYKRGLSENENLKFKIDVIARIPGKFQGPSSRAYLYYCEEHKIWKKGMECEIQEI